MNEEVKIKMIRDKNRISHLCILRVVPKWVAGRIVPSKAWVSIKTGQIIRYVQPKRIISSLPNEKPTKPKVLARIKRRTCIDNLEPSK